MSKPKKLDDMTDVLTELEALRAQASKINTRKGELEQLLRGALGAKEEGTVNGVVVVTYANAERAEFDQSAFKAKHPIIAKRFITFKRVRTLLLKTKAFGEAGLHRG